MTFVGHADLSLDLPADLAGIDEIMPVLVEITAQVWQVFMWASTLFLRLHEKKLKRFREGKSSRKTELKG